jgi:hypothetical protein
MTRVEHEIEWVGFREMALISRVRNGRLMEYEGLVTHDMVVGGYVCVRPDGAKRDWGEGIGTQSLIVCETVSKGAPVVDASTEEYVFVSN